MEVERFGGSAKVFPLIQTRETIVQDQEFIKKIQQYEWLIFTSQNAVSAFYSKVKRHDLDLNSINSRIAAVGIKTSAFLEALGLKVDFMPSVYSADVFVREFPAVSKHSEKCLFLRGSLAKPTIKAGLIQQVDEWTVYETLPDVQTAGELAGFLAENRKAIIAFASPSAVKVFSEHVAPAVGWEAIKTAAIGHITAEALRKHGAQVHVLPKVYTWLALVQEIAKWKDDQKNE